MKGHEFQYQKTERPGVVVKVEQSGAIVHYRFIANAYIDTDDGVVRWAKNDNVPPSDCLRDMAKQGLITPDVEEASNWTRKLEEEKLLKQQAKFRQKNDYSAEELAEMREVFGEGARVIDVTTGQRVPL
jgi:hypothetical protein